MRGYFLDAKLQNSGVNEVLFDVTYQLAKVKYICYGKTSVKFNKEGLMAACPGKRIPDNKSCLLPVYRCKKCGGVGCDPGGKVGSCTNQAFSLSKCVKCGTYGQRESA